MVSRRIFVLPVFIRTRAKYRCHGLSRQSKKEGTTQRYFKKRAAWFIYYETDRLFPSDECTGLIIWDNWEIQDDTVNPIGTIPSSLMYANWLSATTPNPSWHTHTMYGCGCKRDHETFTKTRHKLSGYDNSSCVCGSTITHSSFWLLLLSTCLVIRYN